MPVPFSSVKISNSKAYAFLIFFEVSDRRIEPVKSMRIIIKEVIVGIA